MHRDAAADRHRGLELLMQVRDMWLRSGSSSMRIPVTRRVRRAGERPGAATAMLP